MYIPTLQVNKILEHWLFIFSHQTLSKEIWLAGQENLF